MAHQTAEEQTYWQKWVSSRDQEAGDYLVRKYMPLVSYHVQRISVSLPKNVSRDDIKSLGFMGLYDALQKFDPNRDLKFDTYASFRIRGAIIDGLRKEDWLPRSTREKTKKIEAAIEQLEQRLLRNATIDEIANELNLPPEEVHTSISEQFFSNLLFIDEHANDEDQEGFSNMIKDEKAIIPDQKVEKDELIQEMSRMIVELNDKEQLVLSLFYKEELTLTEIGEVMNLSTSRISQIHSKAIFKLRKSLEKIV